MNYTLRKNPLTPDQNDCIGRPVNTRTRTIDDLIERLNGVMNNYNPSEIKSFINSYWGTIAAFIKDGEEYRDENVSIRLGITGSFENEWDRFDNDRHKVTANANLSSRIKDSTDEISMTYKSIEENSPKIKNVFDWSSRTDNEKLTPGGVIEIKGLDLKFSTHERREGIFFINKESQEEVKADFIRSNKPKTIRCIVPELAPGNYFIQIRTATSVCSELRKSKTELEFIVE